MWDGNEQGDLRSVSAGSKTHAELKIIFIQKELEDNLQAINISSTI
jgi:hypothetical protein